MSIFQFWRANIQQPAHQLAVSWVPCSLGPTDGARPPERASCATKRQLQLQRGVITPVARGRAPLKTSVQEAQYSAEPRRHHLTNWVCPGVWFYRRPFGGHLPSTERLVCRFTLCPAPPSTQTPFSVEADAVGGGEAAANRISVYNLIGNL